MTAPRRVWKPVDKPALETVESSDKPEVKPEPAEAKPPWWRRAWDALVPISWAEWVGFACGLLALVIMVAIAVDVYVLRPWLWGTQRGATPAPLPAVTVTATPSSLPNEVGAATVERVELTSGGARIIRCRIDTRVFGCSELAGGLRTGDRIVIYRNPTATPTPSPKGTR